MKSIISTWKERFSEIRWV